MRDDEVELVGESLGRCEKISVDELDVNQSQRQLSFVGDLDLALGAIDADECRIPPIERQRQQVRPVAASELEDSI